MYHRWVVEAGTVGVKEEDGMDGKDEALSGLADVIYQQTDMGERVLILNGEGGWACRR